MKLYSWNVNGIRAAMKKDFASWLKSSDAQIVCIQETKAHEDQLNSEITDIAPYRSVWSSGERRGYSGVANYFTVAPENTSFGFGIEERFDREGRILIAEYDSFTLLNIYFPNGQKDDERLQYKLDFYDATLDFCEGLRKQGHSLVICGDYNTAHNEIDIARPKENEKNSGFLRIERDWMDKFESFGYIDTFRKLYPDAADRYSWWSFRANARPRNVGWRLDYFYVTPDLWNKVVDAGICDEVEGSDHCPVWLELNV